ncbi:hypothetical protein LCGC14_3114700, partial [marine sediment metagenome]
ILTKGEDVNTQKGKMDIAQKVRRKSTKGEDVLTESTPETTTKTTSETIKAEPSPVDIIFKAIHAYYGFPDNGEPDPIPSYGKEGGAIKHMLKRGFTPAQIMECWSEKTKKRKSWVTMVWVNDDISGAPVMMESDKYANQKYGHMVHR